MCGWFVYGWRRARRPFSYPNDGDDHGGQAQGGDGGDGGEQVEPAAWRLLGLAFLCMIICSLDRVAMSVAILPMALEFGFSETTKVRSGVRVLRRCVRIKAVKPTSNTQPPPTRLRPSCPVRPCTDLTPPPTPKPTPTPTPGRHLQCLLPRLHELHAPGGNPRHDLLPQGRAHPRRRRLVFCPDSEPRGRPRQFEHAGACFLWGWW